MALHPDLQAFLELVNAQPKSLSEGSVEQARQSYDLSSQLIDECDNRLTKTLQITARDGKPLLIRQYGDDYKTANQVILFFHGGGYVLGSLDSHNTLCHRLADYCHCQVFSVDYRLAPEYRFPTAFEDACDAYQWLVRKIVVNNKSSKDIVVVGDSVGATLATNLCIEAKAQLKKHSDNIQNSDISWQIPSKQILLYPCTSAHQKTNSHNQYANGYLLESKTLQWMFGQYLTTEQRTDWRFAPLRHDNLSGLPPALIILPEYDPLIDEGHMYAKKLVESNVQVKTQVFKGVTHDFARFGNLVPDTIEELMTVISQFALT